MLSTTLVLLCLVVGTLAWEQRPEKYDDGEYGWVPGKFPRGMDGNNEGAAGLLQKVMESNITISPLIDIFPPKWYPGDILKKTAFPDIDKALDDVMRAGDLMHDRRCAVGVANVGGAKLDNPRLAFYSGQTHSAPAYEISPGETGLNLFIKLNGALAGTVGVLTYDIVGTDYKVAIMWSVPYSFVIYDVWFNLKVYPKSSPTNRGMWDQMYYNSGPWRTGGYEERNEYGVKFQGTMTDNRFSKLIVWVDTTDFDVTTGPNLFTDCKYHPGWVASYCTQECSPRGWCWVNKRCGDSNGCQGKLACYGSC